MNRTAATTCSCGGPKAPRARLCFNCLALEVPTGRSFVSVAIGEPGPRYYAHRADGTSRRFATHQAAATWAADATPSVPPSLDRLIARKEAEVRNGTLGTISSKGTV